MQPLSGPGTPPVSDRHLPSAKTGPTPPGENQPLTSAQRTTLEKLVVKIMALTPMKAAELWATLRHDLHVPNEGEISAGQFPQAEQNLQSRLSSAQESHATRQLLQQLTELLPLGNNRQAVSDFIRQNFGHTVLSQLSHEQLHQVLALIQSGGLTIPPPQQTPVMDRPVLPAEQRSLQQQVARLSAATGEKPAKLWQELFRLAGVSTTDPMPARHFQVITQYLQARHALSQQTSPTLHSLHTALKHPASAEEQQQLTEYAQTQFNAGPATPLTAAQLHDLLGMLFSRRVDRSATSASMVQATPAPQPLVSPLIALLPRPLQGAGGVPLLFAACCVVLVILWLLF
ncbi:flagella biosynthesis regulator Flk [Chimaeribacter coloradensis]|uniref:Flagella biosynthesis regulator Flk n=1 Tax=Chimaeribacter coloradensis TaxID=2060068 RepID=A0A2N5E1U3_9GAMM|nr:flagella biosynthesis regulator Flk [Chimaeribacter coloradensis]PLR34422.1 flagella biosynthesis regulator Flk [Chimaeribacter coloradensis]